MLQSVLQFTLILYRAAENILWHNLDANYDLIGYFGRPVRESTAVEVRRHDFVMRF